MRTVSESLPLFRFLIAQWLGSYGLRRIISAEKRKDCAMHGSKLRDIFPAHHAIELEIPRANRLLVIILSIARQAGNCWQVDRSTDRPPAHRRGVENRCRPSNLAAGLHVRTAARNGPYVEAVRAVSRTAYSIFAMPQS